MHHLTDEEREDIRLALLSDRATIRYWLLTGVPDGSSLNGVFSQSLIDEVQAEIDEENGLRTCGFITEVYYMM